MMVTLTLETYLAKVTQKQDILAVHLTYTTTRNPGQAISYKRSGTHEGTPAKKELA